MFILYVHVSSGGSEGCMEGRLEGGRERGEERKEEGRVHPTPYSYAWCSHISLDLAPGNM